MFAELLLACKQNTYDMKLYDKQCRPIYIPVLPSANVVQRLVIVRNL